MFQKWTPFLSSNSLRKKCADGLSTVDLYCKCREPFFEEDPDEDQGLFMIKCNIYQEWFHKKCQSVNQINFQNFEPADNINHAKKLFMKEANSLDF